MKVTRRSVLESQCVVLWSKGGRSDGVERSERRIRIRMGMGRCEVFCFGGLGYIGEAPAYTSCPSCCGSPAPGAARARGPTGGRALCGTGGRCWRRGAPASPPRGRPSSTSRCCGARTGSDSGWVWFRERKDRKGERAEASCQRGTRDDILTYRDLTLSAFRIVAKLVGML